MLSGFNGRPVTERAVRQRCGDVSMRLFDHKRRAEALAEELFGTGERRRRGGCGGVEGRAHVCVHYHYHQAFTIIQSMHHVREGHINDLWGEDS